MQSCILLQKLNLNKMRITAFKDIEETYNTQVMAENYSEIYIVFGADALS